MNLISPLLLLCVLFSALHVGFAGAGGESPFTPKASLLRYWNKHISNHQPKPDFLISKASPLTAVEAATFANLAAQNALSTRLPAFCAAANLLCFPDLGRGSLEKHSGNSKFAVYKDKSFTNYGTGGLGGANSFKNYSDNEPLPTNNFRRYSHDSVGHDDKFESYGTNGNGNDQSFNSYAPGASGGSGEFSAYVKNINTPNLRFNTYSTEANGRDQTFDSYSESTNAGSESFTSYGKHGNAAGNEFAGYSRDSNVVGSTFSSYGDGGNSANDTFKGYGNEGNVPVNNFNNYGEGGNGAVDSFTTYRDKSNEGDDSFQSYAKNSNSAEVEFGNYGESYNGGDVTFTGYGKGAQSEKIGFTGYGATNTINFKEYRDKRTVSFKDYAKKDSSGSGKSVNKWVEPGKFFREASLKQGSVLPMPDIRDKMPKRSFLPRTISSKLPFSTAKLPEMKRIFHAGDNSTMEAMFVAALADCERAPSPGETKRCVASVEDMIEFATTVLGHDVVVRSTENVNGAKQDVLIGTVKGINGGKLTKSVSCHQSLYPYMLYYCHSVPKVRVYVADILDPKSKSKINHGVAICHIDTSSWSAGHGAFLALGSGPGKIEVCHWIFEGDMTWARAD